MCEWRYGCGCWREHVLVHSMLTWRTAQCVLLHSPLPAFAQQDIAKNELTTLEPVAGLRRLRILHADDNHIYELPSMAKLLDLRTLELQKNKLISLPDDLGALPALHGLR